jgi:RNA polymerase sigma-70 factor (ECF subfamily)
MITMATRAIDAVLDRLRRTMVSPDGGGLADGELLGHFITQRDEAAFEALVRRHGPMVLGVCRRILRNEADAEDAFQATFLVLVKKAASIWPRGMVGNWLYGVAHTTALKAKVMRSKRRAKETEAGTRAKPDASPEVWRQLEAVLDQELQALPDKYRAPIVLCDLEGKSIQEAARQLDAPPGTIGTRLARGRVLLARRLARHGLTLSGAVIATVLTQNATAGVPLPLVASTVKAASQFAAGPAVTGALAAEVAALTQGVLKTMLLNKLKLATMLLLGAILTCAGVGLLSREVAAGQTEPRRRLDAPPRDARPTDKPDPAKEREDRKKKELEKLRGKWKGVSVEIAGKALPEDVAGSTVWDIGDEKITAKAPNIKEGKEEEVWPFHIDPTEKPAHLDAEGEVDGKKIVMKGIYKLDGDELTVCLFGADGGRPAEFSSSDLSNGEKGGNMLLKFKREKEPKKEPDRKPPKPEPEFEGRKLSEWVEQLRSTDVVERQGAILALGKLGPAAVPALAEGLKDKEIVNVRIWAAWGLRRLGAEAKAAVPQLEAALQDESGLVRVEVARALWAIEEQKTAIPALIDLLAHKDPNTRWGAASALEGIGPKAKAAIPALLKTRKDAGLAQWGSPDGTVEYKPVGLAIEKALKKIDPEAAKKEEQKPEAPKKP